MNAKTQEVIKLLNDMSVVELSELKERLITDLGITMPQTFTSFITEKKEDVVEQTEFTVILNGYESSNKIGAIKEIRALTGLGLVESKNAVENLPFIIKESIDKKSAEDIKAKFESIGALVEIK